MILTSLFDIMWAMLWALPTLRTILTNGLDLKLFRLGSNCKSHKLAFSILGFRVETHTL